MKYKYSILLLSALALVAAGCRQVKDGRGRDGGDAPVRPGRMVLEVDTARLWVEVADLPEARQAGLMFRRSMPHDEGMLFVFEEPQQLQFWMKNTYLPLDIAFVSDDGTIINIESMKPLDEVPRYRSKGPARFAIEANRGWFAARGIGPGDRIRF